MTEKDTETMTNYDNYTAEELNTALQRYFLYSDLDDAAVEEMDQILAALKKKVPFPHPQEVEEKWAEFQAEHADELATLGIRKDEDTEEVVEQEPEADETVLSSAPVPIPRSRRPGRSILRVGLVAAAVVVLMAALTVMASAMGFNLWGWVPKWTDADVRFVAETPVQEPGEDDTHGIPTVLESLGITEPLYPTWLPEDMARVETKTIERPLFLQEKYQGNNRRLIITISPTTGSENAVYQKENTPPDEYLVSNVVHYLFSNSDEVTAVWYTEHYTTTIVGNISMVEMKTVIDSVYEVKK